MVLVNVKLISRDTLTRFTDLLHWNIQPEYLT